MRNFVSGENKLEKTTGRILVGTMNIKPSGIGTSRPFSKMYVLRSVSFEPISWSSSPSSRQRSAAQGFSVRKESGPASTTHPSTYSVEITPPRHELDSYEPYGNGTPTGGRCPTVNEAE